MNNIKALPNTIVVDKTVASTLTKLGGGHEGARQSACFVGVDEQMMSLALALDNHDIAVDCTDVVRCATEYGDPFYLATHSEWARLVSMCKEALTQGIQVLLLYNDG